MAAAVVPTTEPTHFNVGDSVTWEISNTDYPASGGWTLKYALVSSVGKIAITTTASGEDHLVSLSAATTAAYQVGEYSWQSYVENVGATERYAIATGKIDIRANYSTQTYGLDARSWTKVTLDAVRARLRGDASTVQLSRRVGDLAVSEIPLLDLLKIETELANRYAQEVNDEQLDRGVRSTANKIKTRFV
jgi:hypothetical protein